MPADPADQIKHLDLFSGIGGFSLGLERTGGFKTVAFCEIEVYPRKVLAQHWPDVPIYNDIRKLTKERLYADGLTDINIITGGYPCQPFSVAGKQRGEKDDRHLWPEMYRIIKAVRPQWVIAENVAGHINMGLDTVLSDMEAEDYTCWPFVIPACAVDARHRRDRIWIVAYAGRLCDESQRERGICACAEEEMQSETRQQRIRTEATDGGENVANPPGVYAQRYTQGQGQGEFGRGGRWPAEPNVGRVVARLSTRMDGGRLNGQTSNTGTGEILRALQGSDAAQKIQWPARGFWHIQTQEILLSELCQYQGKAKPLGNISLESEETSQIILRGVWFDGSTACPSCRRTAEEQRTREHPDIVHLLSQILACDCVSAWLDPTGTPSESSRTDRLKGLGNAVVPQIPELIGRAILASDNGSRTF